MAKIAVIGADGEEIYVPEDLTGEEKAKKEKKVDGDMEDVAGAIEKAYVRGAKTRAFMEGSGLSQRTGITANVGGGAEEQAARTGLTILGNIIESTLNRLDASQNRPGVDESTKAALETMKGQIGEIKEALRPSSAPANPFDIYRSVKAELDGWAAELLARTGYQGQTVNAGAEDIPKLLELEDRKLEREERQRQHDKEMAEDRRRYEDEKSTRDRQWKKEDDRWERQHQMDMAKFGESKKTRDGAMETFKDMGESVIDALESGGESTPPVETEVKMSIPEISECPQCHAKVAVPEGVDFVVCPGCKQSLKVSEAA